MVGPGLRSRNRHRHAGAHLSERSQYQQIALAEATVHQCLCLVLPGDFNIAPLQYTGFHNIDITTLVNGMAGYYQGVLHLPALQFRRHVLTYLQGRFAPGMDTKGIIDLRHHVQLPGAVIDGAFGAHHPALPFRTASQFRMDRHPRTVSRLPGVKPVVFRQVDKGQVTVAYRQAYFNKIHGVDFRQRRVFVHHLSLVHQLVPDASRVGRDDVGAFQFQARLVQRGSR